MHDAPVGERDHRVVAPADHKCGPRRPAQPQQTEPTGDHAQLDRVTADRRRAPEPAKRAVQQHVETTPGGTDKAIDRNLSAYENGTLDEDTLAERLPALRATTKQLRRRREQLAVDIDAEPDQPDPATLADVAHHITDIITSGTDNQRKGLIEALIDRVAITAPGSLRPVLRIPNPRRTPPPQTRTGPPPHRRRPLPRRFVQ